MIVKSMSLRKIFAPADKTKWHKRLVFLKLNVRMVGESDLNDIILDVVWRRWSRSRRCWLYARHGITSAPRKWWQVPSDHWDVIAVVFVCVALGWAVSL